MLQLKMPITLFTSHILTKDALDFVEKLVIRFEHQRLTLLHRRREFDARLAKGAMPNFRDDTREIRESDWRAARPPADLLDHRIEITGPASDPKMVINAFNSGAKVYMSDFEDSETPNWWNMVQGQSNLYEAVRGKLKWYDSEKNKNYKLNDERATLMVRPRGLHLSEMHVVTKYDMPISASLFDFGMFFFHNAKELIINGYGPYFYLPKMEHYEEAQWWADVFAYAEELLDFKVPVIKATVLIETITAAFQMDEILHALRVYSAGLNCGRWDYIFSFIKKFKHNPRFLMPDRLQIGMDQHFLRSYAELLVKTCHKRGVHAIGGMSAFIPVKDDVVANENALNKVREDKHREVAQGFDGTWVAHPGLVLVAQEVFDKYMPTSNQIHEQREDVKVSAEDLLRVPQGFISREGVRTNIRVAITYIESWLRGIGCVPIDNLMEDMATAEISRMQLWQWLHGDVFYRLRDDISPPALFTKDHFEYGITVALEAIKKSIGLEKMLYGKYAIATQILRDIVQLPESPEFLSTYLMQTLMKMEGKKND